MAPSYLPLTDTPPPYGAVVFDCDSTLSTIEGIEALAGPEHAAELEQLTNAAMDGELPLEEVYGKRLELVRPTRAAVERVGRLYAENAVRNAGRLVSALRTTEKQVAIVSGGLLPAVSPFARELGVAPELVAAVDVEWTDAGEYLRFDEGSPLARAGGKIEVLDDLRRRLGGPLAFVGDGATDLEAAHVAARFIAFGGVVRRQAVFTASLVHCDAADFAALLPLLFTTREIDELRRDPDHLALVESASPWLPPA